MDAADDFLQLMTVMTTIMNARANPTR